MSTRTIYGHRVHTLPSGEDWCLGCGRSPSPTAECRPGTPRCEQCVHEGQDVPADVLEYVGGERFAWCAAHRLGLRGTS